MTTTTTTTTTTTVKTTPTTTTTTTTKKTTTKVTTKTKAEDTPAEEPAPICTPRNTQRPPADPRKRCDKKAEKTAQIDQIVADCIYESDTKFVAKLNGATATVYHADAFEMLETMEPDSFDMLLADPPYNVLKDAKFDLPPWDIERYIDLVCKVVKNDGVIVVFGSSLQLARYEAAFEKNKKIAVNCVWSKTNPDPKKLGITNGIEHFLVAYSKETAHLYVKTEAAWNTIIAGGITANERVKNVDDESLEGKENHLHPTQKPAELNIKILEKFSDPNPRPGYRILDTCAGSGAIVRTCLVNGIDSVSIECDPHYFHRGNAAYSNEKIMKAVRARSAEGKLSMGEIHKRGIDQVLKKTTDLDDAKRDEFFRELFGYKYYCFEKEEVVNVAGKKGFASMFQL
ncbi:MAG: site-specific DNA-methyltransferase [Pseudodesulfovibrio sp.]|nr:site-specific DNA-methyltransferase [Pseudodesulfovibrio sp.]